MKVKAKLSFAGIVCMHGGAIRDISDTIAADLIKSGYVEEVIVPPAPTSTNAEPTAESEPAATKAPKTSNKSRKSGK